MAKILALFIVVSVFVTLVSGTIHGIPSYGLSQVDQLRYNFFELEGKLWRDVLNSRSKEETDSSQTSQKIKIAREFSKFCADLEAKFPSKNLRDLDVVVVTWPKFAAERLNIDRLYDSFKIFIDRQVTTGTPSEQRAWLNQASTVLQSPKDSVPLVMARLHNLVMQSVFYNQLLQESNKNLCEVRQSPNQLLFNTYGAIVLTEIKGYILIQFSLMLGTVFGHGNFTAESILAREKLKQRSTVTLAAFKDVMRQTSREVWRCDPTDHEEVTTYVTVTRLLQGYIENEVDMNGENTCRENCAYYKYAKNHGCFKEMFCSRQKPCTGKIIDCQYIESDMTICPSPYASTKRYEWIEYENKGMTFGKKGACDRGISQVNSWWRWIAWQCSYCFCLCDQADSWSDRYISMIPARSNITDNKVITGLRFVKVNRVIHLQISEGTLEPMGKINQKSVKWQPVKPINIETMSAEYHTLSFEERTIDLDDLKGPYDHVLIGIRFEKVGSHLNFQIETSQFNFKTGKLTRPSIASLWTSNTNSDASKTPRAEVKLTKPDIPTKTRVPSIPDSDSDQYVVFIHSDVESDVAQTTVPYLDAQDVMPAQAVPLSGAGLYHKGQKLYGGFIAPKVFTYDYTQHMEIAIPDL